MGEEAFKEKVKEAFSKVKEDFKVVNVKIANIDKEVQEQRELIKEQNEKILEVMQSIKTLLEHQNNVSEKKLSLQNECSTGNKGVYANTYSTDNYSLNTSLNTKNSAVTSLENPKFDVLAFKQELEQRFASLSRQEFLTFLTLEQLERELGNVSYSDLARRMNLSEGCVRTYVSNLMKKGIPLVKRRLNNKTVNLVIRPDFKELNMRKKLEAIYYGMDPQQKRLGDLF